MNLEDAAQWANVVMAGVSVAGLIAVVLWKRQPKWEHSRNVASDAYEAVVAMEHAFASCIAAYSQARSLLVGKDPGVDARLFHQSRDSMVEVLSDLRAKGRAMYDATAKVRAAWGTAVFEPILIYKLFVETFDGIYERVIDLVASGQPLRELNGTLATPWLQYLDEQQPGHREVTSGWTLYPMPLPHGRRARAPLRSRAGI